MASADALVRERRLDFEMAQLTNMTIAIAETAEGHDSDVAQITLANGLRLLPPDELPNVRGYMSAPPTPEAEVLAARVRTRARHLGGGEMRQATGEDGYGPRYGDLLLDELDAAVRARLEAR